MHNLLNNVIVKNQKQHICFKFGNYNIGNIDNIDGALTFLRLHSLKDYANLDSFMI